MGIEMVEGAVGLVAVWERAMVETLDLVVASSWTFLDGISGQRDEGVGLTGGRRSVSGNVTERGSRGAAMERTGRESRGVAGRGRMERGGKGVWRPNRSVANRRSISAQTWDHLPLKKLNSRCCF